MQQNKKATSIIEAIIMTLILTIGILGLYNIYIKSYNLSVSTKYKIQAIEIAREGIEAMENIRNTNWVLLGADPNNCWNSLNYDNGCVGDNGTSHDITPGLYKIYTDSNGKWLLKSPSTPLTSKNYNNSSYIDFFKVKKDSNGLYTQSGGTNFLPIFTREINISYIDDGIDKTNDLNDGSPSNEEKMNVHSIVIWQDSQGNKTHIIDLETMLTNWKK